jgi:hypothetical protein
VVRSANAVLQELVLHVRPPRGRAIVLTERTPSGPGDQNWVEAIGLIGNEVARHFTEKVAALRKSDPQVDWSGVEILPGCRRRVALYLSEVETTVQAGGPPSAGTAPKVV